MAVSCFLDVEERRNNGITIHAYVCVCISCIFLSQTMNKNSKTARKVALYRTHNSMTVKIEKWSSFEQCSFCWLSAK